ncbi:MAG: ABC transporter permease [Spirochaetia bacterium]|nr:ABC transporter permease [Spirochaetia bacterium]
MVRFYAGKISQYLILLFLASTLNFALPRLMPGDPLLYVVGEDVTLMSAEEKDAMRTKMGLNRPIIIQYFSYLGEILQGDLGYSYRENKPVTEVISKRLPWTLLLAALNIIISTILGIISGALAAWKRGSKTDLGLGTLMIFLRSMPSFWVGMILVAIFGATLKWFPVYGAYTMWSDYSGFAYVLDVLKHLVLPLVTMVILSVTSIFITMRYSMINILGEDYITMAELKGVPQKIVKYRHAMRNALVPVVTVVMMNIGYMVGGATVVETVFAYPGTGRLLFEAVSNRDYPLIQGCFFVTTLCVIAANILADLLYPFLDPKVV